MSNMHADMVTNDPWIVENCLHMSIVIFKTYLQGYIPIYWKDRNIFQYCRDEHNFLLYIYKKGYQYDAYIFLFLFSNRERLSMLKACINVILQITQPYTFIICIRIRIHIRHLCKRNKNKTHTGSVWYSKNPNSKIKQTNIIEHEFMYRVEYLRSSTKQSNTTAMNTWATYRGELK